MQNENDKNTNFLMKNIKKMQENMQAQSIVLYSELAQLTHDAACFKIERYRENISDQKLSAEHTPDHAFTSSLPEKSGI